MGCTLIRACVKACLRACMLNRSNTLCGTCSVDVVVGCTGQWPVDVVLGCVGQWTSRCCRLCWPVDQ